METKMITKRVFFTISVLMFLVLFLFQFTGIVRRKYNDFDNNSFYISTQTGLDEDDQHEIMINDARILSDKHRYVVYIGNINSRIGNTILEWCKLTKRNLIVRDAMRNYKLDITNKPDMVLVDSDYADYIYDLEDLKYLSWEGVNVTICNMPSYEKLADDTKMMDYCGIKQVARNVKPIGVRVFDDFLLGGEMWFIPENDDDGSFNDFDFTLPWYTTTTGTKTYMAAELDREEYEIELNEQQPSMIWRKRQNDAYVFCINGDLISDISGIGVLSAIMYAANDYEIYPAVDAKVVVVDNYPYLSDEMDNEMLTHYSKDTFSVLHNVIWPDISKLSDEVATDFTYMMAPQLNYSDSKGVSINTLDYFFRLIREKNTEIGLSSLRGEKDSLIDKFAADHSSLASYVPNYEFLAVSLEKSELETVNAIDNPLLKRIRTYVTGPEDYRGDHIFSYYDKDKTVVEIPIDVSKYTFSYDLRNRMLNTALGYTVLDMDLKDIYTPQEGELWNIYAKKTAAAIRELIACCKNISSCTISELDMRIRELLTLDYITEPRDKSLAVSIYGEQKNSRFIFRSGIYDIESVSGGTYYEIDKNSYIITTTDNNIVINFKDKSLK